MNISDVEFAVHMDTLWLFLNLKIKLPNLSRERFIQNSFFKDCKFEQILEITCSYLGCNFEMIKQAKRAENYQLVRICQQFRHTTSVWFNDSYTFYDNIIWN